MRKDLGETATVDKLIEVAVDLFSVKGFAGTSIRDIARNMNMTMGAIYNYFSRKDDLFFFIVEKTVRAAKEELLGIAEMDLPPMERFELMLRVHFTNIGTHLKESSITFLEDEHYNPEKKKRVREEQNEFTDLYVKEIERLKDAGFINSSVPSRILVLNILATLTFFVRWYNPKGRLSLSQMIEYVINFITFGVTGQPVPLGMPCQDRRPKGRPKQAKTSQHI
jgi:TetR/AcrR family transcriptional regulator, cholesterol catabolism regulator